MQYARAEVKTVRGTIRSAWKRNFRSFDLQVEVPVNSKAEIYLPKLGMKNVILFDNDKPIYQNDRLFEGVDGITKSSETDGHVIVSVGSGAYIFRLEEQKK